MLSPQMPTEPLHPSKPLFRWAGSKKKLLPVLAQYWKPSYKRYVEPFAGSASLFFNLNPKKAILGDVNPEIIGTYQTIRKSPQKVFKALAQFKPSKENYYVIRSLDASTLSDVDSAARFIYLNRYCFNGLYRTNQAGKFNVPYGGEKNGSLPQIDDLIKLSQRLKNCSLICGDFEKVLKKCKDGDFVYMDPPFAVGNRRIFRQYGPQNFGIEDLERLSSNLNRLDEIGASFVISYAYCKEALNLLGSWNRRKVFVRRNIAGFSKDRRKAAEIIVTNI